LLPIARKQIVRFQSLSESLRSDALQAEDPDEKRDLSRRADIFGRQTREFILMVAQAEQRLVRSPARNRMPF
jgi:hypothetical protein